MFLNNFFYFALKFRSNILTFSIKRTTRFYTTILIHLYTKKSFFYSPPTTNDYEEEVNRSMKPVPSSEASSPSFSPSPPLSTT